MTVMGHNNNDNETSSGWGNWLGICLLALQTSPSAHHVTSCIAVWFGKSIAPNRKTLQCLVNEARKITGASLSFLLEIYNNRLNRQSLQHRGQLHPPLTQLLQSPVLGEKSVLCGSSTRLHNSFIHQLVSKLNSLPSLPRLPFAPKKEL